jgi:hypothetical protein
VLFSAFFGGPDLSGQRRVRINSHLQFGAGVS